MANEQNLKTLTHDEAVKIGQIGGRKSATIRNHDKGFKRLLKDIGRQEIKDTEAKKQLTDLGLDADIRNYIFLQVFNEATKNNNYKAQQKLLDLFCEADTEFTDSVF